MKKGIVVSSLLAISILVGCSDKEEPQSDTKTENIKPAEQNEQPTSDATMTVEQLQPLLEAVKKKAFSSMEHEGEVILEERHMQGSEQIDYLKSSIEYSQNDNHEGLYGENQLYYKKHLEYADGTGESSEVYIQPDKVMYTFNDSAGWQGYDFMDIGEMGLTRVSYLSPADIIGMLELNESTVKVIDEKNDEVIISFEPSPEAQIELLYSVLGEESFYHMTDMALEFEEFSIQLVLSKNLETLRTVLVDIKQVNIDDETEYLESHYQHQYTADKLTQEIRPNKAVFAQAGLSIWD